MVIHRRPFRHSTGRKAVSFQQGVRNFNQRLGDFVICKGIQNSSVFDSTSGQNPRSSAHDKNRSTDNRNRNQRLFESGAIRKVGNASGEFLSNIF